MASEYRAEVQRAIDSADLHTAVDLIELGVKLGLEAAAAAAKESELREGTAAEGADGPEFAAAIEGEAVAHNIGLAILSLSPTDILKAKGGKP